MSRFDIILFDFDGTVADTSPGIKEGLLHTFEINGMPLMTDGEMDKFIGPPLDESFVKYCRVTPEKARSMVLEFREHYHLKAIDKFIIYDGLENVLQTLNKKGVAVAVATSKPEPMALHILEKANLCRYFDIIQGSTLDGRLIKKSDIIKEVIKKANDKYNAPLMVGDTEFDINGAHVNDIPCLWVGYGFGTFENAMKSKPEYVAKNMDEMTEFFKLL